MPADSSDEPIPTHRLDTSELAAEEQFAGWARHTPNTRLTPARPGAFLAQGAFWNLGLAVVAESRLDGFVAERDHALLHATAADHFMIVAVFDGETRFQAEGVDDACAAGDVFICDFKRESVLTTDGVYCATVSMPRPFVQAALAGVELHGRLPRGPATDFLATTLRGLVRELPGLPQSSAPFYARVVRDLLAAAAAALPRRGPPADSSRRARVIAYAASQPPGALKIAKVLDAVALTRPTLYRLFKSDGGLMAYDRLRRLRGLHRDLANPLDRRSITELGAAHGFADKAHAARSFRAAFGYSMSTLRQRASALDGTSRLLDTSDRLRETVRRLATA